MEITVYMYKTISKIAAKPLSLLASVVLLSACVAVPATTVPAQSSGDPYWRSGQAELQQRIALIQQKHRAKNVILFIADGMGISTVTATRIYDGQSRGQSGEENSLSFDKFPHVALVKTYNSDSQVPDSAGTASALNTGVKTRRGAINTWATQDVSECFGPQQRFPESIAELAEQAGLSTGIVTTARVTHATPAAVYGHSPSRQWEDDSQLPKKARALGCKDLARQLVEFKHGDGIDVVFGGGRRSFLPQLSGGTRMDKRNLISQWQQTGGAAHYVENAEQFRALDLANTQRVMGLFTDSHMAFTIDRDNAREPSLSEMTASAIDILSRNEKGYFLMVEGARVDHAHHATNAHRALTDAQAFANAVQTAVDKVDLKDTLILVTADHSHLMTFAGYPGRGNPILGLVHDRELGTGKLEKEPYRVDGKPYTTLGYYIGSHLREADHQPLTQAQVTAADYLQQSAIRGPYGGHHAGEDVALFATGAKSHLVGGVIEQHTVFHIITHALGWTFTH